MPFDFDAVMADPQFQMGMGLLGTSSPKNKALLDAFNLLQGIEQRKQLAAKQKSDEAYRQAQIEQAHAQVQQSGARTKVYEQDVAQHQRANDMLEKQTADAMKFLQNSGLGGGGAPTAPPMMDQPQTPAPQPMPTANLFGTIDPFVAKIEGGFVPNDGGKGPTNFGINQRANPDINVKALTPEAASQIRKQRYWDALQLDQQPPATASVAYDAAVNQGQGYAKQLLEKTGGDPTLMLYQRRQDYRELAKNPLYAKELKGWESRLNQLGEHIKTQAATPAQPSQTAGLEPSKAMQIAGGMIEMGTKPGAGLTTIGKALEPQQVTPGSFTRDAYGKMTQVPDPKGTQQLVNEQERIAMEQQRVAMERERVRMEQDKLTRTNAGDAQKKQAAAASDYGQVAGVLDHSKALADSASALRNSPGLDHITGRYSGLPDAMRKIIDPQGMDAKADLDAIGSKVLLSTITSLKALSQNGSTGFGQLSNVEGEHLINSVASLKTAQTTAQLKDRLATVIKSANAATDRAVEVYEQTHDQSVYQGLPKGTRPLRDDTTGEQKKSKNGLPLLRLPSGKLVEVRP